MIFLLSLILILIYWIDIRLSITLSLFILMLVFILKNKEHNIEFNIKDKIFFIYGIFALIPVINNFEQGAIFLKIVFYSWLLSFVFQNINYSVRRLKIIYFTIIFTAAIISIIMFFQSAPRTFDFDINYMLTKDRTYGFYFIDESFRVGPTTIATMLIVVLSYILASIRFDIGNILINILLFIFFLFLLIISAGRTAILTLILIILFFFYQNSKNKKQKYFYLIFAPLAGISLLIIIFNYIVLFQNTSFLDRFYLILTPGQDSSALTRLFLWTSSLETIINNPFGVGFYYFFEKYGLTAHNEFLGQALGAGLVGLALFVTLLITIFIMSYKQLNNTPNSRLELMLSSYFTISILFIGLMAMLTENISLSNQNIFYPILWITIGIFFGVRKSINSINKLI